MEKRYFPLCLKCPCTFMLLPRKCEKKKLFSSNSYVPPQKDLKYWNGSKGMKFFMSKVYSIQGYFSDISGSNSALFSFSSYFSFPSLLPSPLPSFFLTKECLVAFPSLCWWEQNLMRKQKEPRTETQRLQWFLQPCSVGPSIPARCGHKDVLVALGRCFQSRDEACRAQGGLPAPNPVPKAAVAP